MNIRTKKWLSIVSLVLFACIFSFGLGVLVSTQGTTTVDNSFSPDTVKEQVKGVASDITEDELLDYFDESLTATTSPARLVLILDTVLTTVDDAQVQDIAVAKYINHLQYFSSLYSNFTSYYGNVLIALAERSSNIFDEEVDSVLGMVLSEIDGSHLKLVVPGNGQASMPFVVVDFDAIKTDFSQYSSNATMEYIAIKELVLSGGLEDSFGQYYKQKIGDFILRLEKFITTYPGYPLIEDIYFNYSLAGNIYMDIHNFSGPFLYSLEDAVLYESLLGSLDERLPMHGIVAKALSLFEQDIKVDEEISVNWKESLRFANK